MYQSLQIILIFVWSTFIYRGNAIKDKDAQKTSMDICSQAPPLSHFTQLRRDTRGIEEGALQPPG